MGRYTLEINKQPIEGFTKVKLDEIDKFTIDSECVYDVLEKLKLNNIKGIKNLKITYQMNRMTKQLDVALDRESDLRYIKIQPNGELDYSNRVFKRYADSFCKKIRDDKQFYEFVMSSKSITEKLKQYIQLDVENNNSYYEDKIQKHLGTYLQFRNVLFLLEEYEWYSARLQYDKASKKDERTSSPLDGEDYTDEEKRAYQEYMDNLPDNEPDYRLR